MRPLCKIPLNLCSLQKNLPKHLLYGPIEERGCGLKDPYYLQLAYHLFTVLKHHARDTATSDLLDENMDCIQYYIGSDQNFWELPFELYGFLAPDGWMKSTWEALLDTSLTIKGENLATRPQREHDTHLMDVFVHLPTMDRSTLLTLQKCRLFLGVSTLSEICTADGAFINIEAWTGTTPAALKPRDIPALTPSRDDWIIWQHWLRVAFLFPQTTSRYLRQRLGPWHIHTPTRWQWYRQNTDHHLFQRTPQGWVCWTRCHASGNYAKYHDPQPYHTELPITSLFPVSIKNNARQPQLPPQEK